MVFKCMEIYENDLLDDFVVIMCTSDQFGNVFNTIFSLSLISVFAFLFQVRLRPAVVKSVPKSNPWDTNKGSKMAASNVKLVYISLVLSYLVASEALPHRPPTTISRSRAFKNAPAYRNQIVSSRAGKSVSSFPIRFVMLPIR